MIGLQSTAGWPLALRLRRELSILISYKFWQFISVRPRISDSFSKKENFLIVLSVECFLFFNRTAEEASNSSAEVSN